MAGNGENPDLTEVASEGMLSKESSMDETKQSTWQVLSRYNAAVLSPNYTGITPIIWGMDVLVS
jgi:hypothetical protein